MRLNLSVRVSTVGLGLCLAAASVNAAVIFSEDFNGATPGGKGPGVISGTNFTVTQNNVDVIGDLNGSNFNCPAPASTNNNCLGLVGVAEGQVTSTSPLLLTAGNTYTISLDLAGEPNQDTPPLAAYTGTVQLGGSTFDVSAAPNSWFTTTTLTFTAGSTGSSNLVLTATNRDARNGFWGLDVDNVTVSESAGASGTPEPGTLGLGALGLLGAGAVQRQRRRSV